MKGMLYCLQWVNPPPLKFSDIVSKRFRIFSPNFTHLLYLPIYPGLQIIIKLPPTVTSLCHIKCDHPACVSAYGGHFEHMMWTGCLRLMWYNFVRVADNWIKSCDLAYIETYNRRVKFGLNIPSRLQKNVRKPQGGFFCWHCRWRRHCLVRWLVGWYAGLFVIQSRWHSCSA